MSNYPQYLLATPIASAGDKVIPPGTASEAGEGRLSQQEGWTLTNSTPLESGGIAPFRDDFNGAFFLLSQFLYWYQQGGLMNYSSSLDYEVGNEVFSNGVKYRALAENGPSTTVKAPGSDPTVWKNMDANIPAGSVIPFYHVTLGGSDGRRPIFWGRQNADEGWVLCDGGSDGLGGTVPNLVDRFIQGSTVANAGQTGGSATQTLSSSQIPAHSHTVTIASSGGHTHTRGTMEITGTHGGHAFKYGDPNLANGAFYFSGDANGGAGKDSNCNVYNMHFQASRSWTGSTSSSGSHTHTATCSTTGSASASVTTVPPYYNMAYFVKLPE